MTVGHAVEDFLMALEKPLTLNEMRVMREPNYSNFRAIVQDTSKWGDEVLMLMRTHAKELGLNESIFDLVHETFWDLYCKKSKNPEIGVKKLEGFISRIKLQVPPRPSAVPEGSEEEPIPAVTSLPLKAILRIRIPLLRPKKEVEGEEEGEETKKEEEAVEKDEEPKKDDQSVEEENLEGLDEIELEDRAHCISTIGESYRVWNIHQAATRWVRKDIAKELKKTLPELQNIDLDDLLEAVDQEGEAVENSFINLFKEGGIKAKQMGYELPVFDFELN